MKYITQKKYDTSEAEKLMLRNRKISCQIKLFRIALQMLVSEYPIIPNVLNLSMRKKLTVLEELKKLILRR
jgi:hypothetical protein